MENMLPNPILIELKRLVKKICFSLVGYLVFFTGFVSISTHKPFLDIVIEPAGVVAMGIFVGVFIYFRAKKIILKEAT